MLLIVVSVVMLVRLGVVVMGTGSASVHLLMMLALCWLAFVPGEVNMLLSGSKRSGAVVVRCVAQVLLAPAASLFWFGSTVVLRLAFEG